MIFGDENLSSLSYLEDRKPSGSDEDIIRAFEIGSGRINISELPEENI